MRYRRFGRTDLQLSVFSLGLMRCCYEQETLQSTVAKAIASGINHLEMARAYGKSEIYLGQALKALEIDRQQIVLTTKFTPAENPPLIEKWLAESLSNLQTDYIDCVAIHGINTEQHLEMLCKSNSCLEILQQAQKSGFVKHIGFSTHGTLDLISKTIATDFFSFVNLHYYYFWQTNAPILELAQKHDLGVFIISPVDKGGQLYQPSEKLSAVCRPFTPMHLNYRFLLSDRRISTLSLGAATPPELDFAIALADNDGELTPDEIKSLDNIQKTLEQNLQTDRCSQCHQCLPCPENINIPEILRLRNLGVGLDMTNYASYRYQMLENAGHWFWGQKGDKCTECGDCLPRCPEKLDIPSLLADSHDRFNGSSGRRLWE